jgi:hypothetical protein
MAPPSGCPLSLSQMIADDWTKEGQERLRNRRKSSSSCGMLRMSKPKEPPLILPGVIAEQSNNLADSVTTSFSLTNAALSYSGLAPNFCRPHEFYITVPAGLANAITRFMSPPGRGFCRGSMTAATGRSRETSSRGFRCRAAKQNASATSKRDVQASRCQL